MSFDFPQVKGTAKENLGMQASLKVFLKFYLYIHFFLKMIGGAD